MNENFVDLPDDPLHAFIQLEEEFRQEFESEAEEKGFDIATRNYISKLRAASRELDIDQLSGWSFPSRPDADEFYDFLSEIDGILVQSRIRASKRLRINSVGLEADQKAKIQAFIEKIREVVETSEASTSKKENVYKILSHLSLEVMQDRTSLARVGDLARGLSGISKSVATEGAEPWWKWMKALCGVVDDAKEKDPALPSSEELKKLEPPRKQIERKT
jgi:hypothetical protein